MSFQDATVCFSARDGGRTAARATPGRYGLNFRVTPYIGVNWLRKLGDTADLARKEREDADALGGVVGIRLWF